MTDTAQAAGLNLYQGKMLKWPTQVLLGCPCSGVGALLLRQGILHAFVSVPEMSRYNKNNRKVLTVRLRCLVRCP